MRGNSMFLPSLCIDPIQTYVYSFSDGEVPQEKKSETHCLHAYFSTMVNNIAEDDTDIRGKISFK